MLLEEVPELVRVVELGSATTAELAFCLLKLPWRTLRLLPRLLVGKKRPKIVAGLPRLIGHLRREPVDVLVTSLANNIIIALWAKHIGGLPTRIIACEGNTASKDAGHASDFFAGVLPALVRQWYPRADAIVAVSDGVADDLGRVAAVSRERIVTIYNGIDIDRVLRRVNEPLADPWFAAGAPPVISRHGRRDPQKDYARCWRRSRRSRQLRGAA